MQLPDWATRWGSSKPSVIGRLALTAALGGVLVAAMALPVVAASGIFVRNTANKITSTSLNVTTLPQRSAIYDRDGRLITYVYSVDEGKQGKYTGVDRQPVDYSKISKNMLTAIVAIEDDRYWQHGAIDFQGTLRAIVNDLQGKSVQGGSDIAQQYVKGVLVLAALGNKDAEQAAIADNLSRKYAELRMALDVAHKMSKQDILAGYLNDAYFAEGAYGIEAAAETYFNTTASKLNLDQAALLAGIVENPSAYDPVINPATALERRNTVLARMYQTHVLTLAAEQKALKRPLGLHLGGQVESGCLASTVGIDGFFCDYVMHTLLLDTSLGTTPDERARTLATGGLKIYTTLSERDQRAATNAVNYVLPQWSNTYNPGRNAATQAMVTPGTGQIMALAEDRPYGLKSGQTTVNYAVTAPYGGSNGVQTGSSSKLFTLITALEQGIPFGYQQTVPGSTTLTGFTNCAGDQDSPWQVNNSEGPGTTTDSLYTGTTHSINVFFAELELKVGLCNVVHTAANMGLTRGDGKSLLANDGNGQLPADDLPAFTLGSVNVSPLGMANAYATVAASGIYCNPTALLRITDDDGDKIAVPPADCHRVLDADVANAATYILKGVLTTGTAASPGVLSNGYIAAGKTGTSNVASGNGTPYAAFAGYTTNLASFTSVFNPTSPTIDTMHGTTACYRLEFGGLDCPGEMFGANAPASIWHMAFDNANLGHWRDFPSVSPGSPLWGKGNGQVVAQPKPTNTPTTGPSRGPGGGGGGNPTPTPTKPHP